MSANSRAASVSVCGCMPSPRFSCREAPDSRARQCLLPMEACIRGAPGSNGRWWRVLVIVRQQLAPQTVRIDQHGGSRHSGNYGHFVRRRTVLKAPLLLAAGPTLTQVPRASAEPSRWSPDRANRWYQAQAWPVGANYITSNAINQLEMFQADTFDSRRIDTELGWARLHGLNTVRVFLHDQLWAQDSRGFQARLAQFVGIASRHRIKPLFVLFDSCWDPLPRLGRQHAPTPGVHNSGWVQSPGAERIDDRRYTRVMQDYVTGVLTQFHNDDRVLGWDLWNEPDNPANQYRNVERSDKLERVAELLPQVFAWARSVDPRQPLTSGVWDGEWADPASRSTIAGIQLANSDVITFHSYAEPATFESRIAELAPQGRPKIG